MLFFCNVIIVTGSAKTCQNAGIFENHFLAFYNSVTQGEYNALCFTSLACSVAKLRAPPFPLCGRKIGIIASEMKLPALQSKFRKFN